jgi:hypothetical protein
MDTLHKTVAGLTPANPREEQPPPLQGQHYRFLDVPSNVVYQQQPPAHHAALPQPHQHAAPNMPPPFQQAALPSPSYQQQPAHFVPPPPPQQAAPHMPPPYQHGAYFVPVGSQTAPYQQQDEGTALSQPAPNATMCAIASSQPPHATNAKGAAPPQSHPNATTGAYASTMGFGGGRPCANDQAPAKPLTHASTVGFGGGRPRVGDAATPVPLDSMSALSHGDAGIKTEDGAAHVPTSQGALAKPPPIAIAPSSDTTNTHTAPCNDTSTGALDDVGRVSRSQSKSSGSPNSTSEYVSVPYQQPFSGLCVRQHACELRTCGEVAKYVTSAGLNDMCGGVSYRTFWSFDQHESGMIALGTEDFAAWDMSNDETTYTQKNLNLQHTHDMAAQLFPSGTPWQNVTINNKLEVRDAAIAFITGECRQSDSGLHKDSTHHLLVALKGSRRVYLHAATVATLACTLPHEGYLDSEQIPIEEFEATHAEHGFVSVDLEAGDALFIEKDRVHRAVGNAGSVGVAFCCSKLM